MKINLRQFAFGFFGCLLLFVLLNILAAHLRSDCGLSAVLGWSGCADAISRAGFPLLFWEEGGFATHSYFFLEAFAADMVIALGISLAAGWAGQNYF